MWLGVTVIRRIRKRQDQRLRGRVDHMLRRYLAVTFPLLVVAAGIETYLMLSGA